MKQAQVALSKDFLTALSRLPKKVAKKVREFTEKFRADPTSSGINLEPLAVLRKPMVLPAERGGLVVGVVAARPLARVIALGELRR